MFRRIILSSSIATSQQLRALSSGALVLAAFYVPHLWFLVFVSLVPFFFSLRKARMLRAAWLGFLLFAVIVGGTSFWCFSYLPPIEGMGGALHGALVAVSWLLITLTLAAPGALLGVALTLGGNRGWRGFALAPLAWILFEAARMYAFLVVSFSSATANPPFYSAGFIGYPLADASSWLQLAAWGGVYLMTFAVVLINYAFFRIACLAPASRARLAAALAFVLVAVTFAPVAKMRASATPAREPLRVGLMSVYLPEDERVPGYKNLPRFLHEVASSTERLTRAGAQVVVLPEGGGFLNTQQQAADSSSPLIIDVVATPTPFGTRENVAYAGLSDRSVTGPVRAKRVLAPQGEYVVGIFEMGAALFGREADLRSVARAIGITSGTWGAGVQIPGTSFTASVMFCIEMLAPGFGARQVRHDGGDLILAMLAHGRFRDSHPLQVDTLRYLRVRAVEASVPLFSSADHGAAYAIDAFGRVVARIGGARMSEERLITVFLP